MDKKHILVRDAGTPPHTTWNTSGAEKWWMHKGSWNGRTGAISWKQARAVKIMSPPPHFRIPYIQWWQVVEHKIRSLLYSVMHLGKMAKHWVEITTPDGGIKRSLLRATLTSHYSRCGAEWNVTPWYTTPAHSPPQGTVQRQLKVQACGWCVLTTRQHNSIQANQSGITNICEAEENMWGTRQQRWFVDQLVLVGVRTGGTAWQIITTQESPWLKFQSFELGLDLADDKVLCGASVFQMLTV